MKALRRCVHNAHRVDRHGFYTEAPARNRSCASTCRAPIGIGDLGAISVLLDSDLRSQQRVMPSHRALIPWPLARVERRVGSRILQQDEDTAPAILPPISPVLCSNARGRDARSSGDSPAA